MPSTQTASMRLWTCWISATRLSHAADSVRTAHTCQKPFTPRLALSTHLSIPILEHAVHTCHAECTVGGMAVKLALQHQG